LVLVEVLAHGRQGDVDDRAVEHHHQLRTGDDEQHQHRVRVSPGASCAGSLGGLGVCHGKLRFEVVERS
jgi:hypothetical protein